MRALTIDAHGELDQLKLRDDLPVPELIADDECPSASARCGAQPSRSLGRTRRSRAFGSRPAWILGSDCAGVVDAIGSTVTSVRVGDRVVVNPGVSDRTCEYCRTGDNPLCLRYRHSWRASVRVVWPSAIVVPAANVLSIPASVSFVVAAAFPLATLTAWRMVVSRAQVRANRRGAGSRHRRRRRTRIATDREVARRARMGDIGKRREARTRASVRRRRVTEPSIAGCREGSACANGQARRRRGHRLRWRSDVGVVARLARASAGAS